jgi:hypothetical protein
MSHRLVFKVLEIILSTAFLVLCTKAFCSHFYRDLRKLFHKRRQPGHEAAKLTAMLGRGSGHKNLVLFAQ